MSTYILRSSESDTGDAVHLLEAQAKQGLTRLALRARLDLVEGGGGGRVLVMAVAVSTMIVVVVRVVRDLFDGGRHDFRKEVLILEEETASSLCHCQCQSEFLAYVSNCTM